MPLETKICWKNSAIIFKKHLRAKIFSVLKDKTGIISSAEIPLSLSLSLIKLFGNIFFCR